MQNLLVKRMREQQLINEIFQDSSRFSDAAAVYNYFRNRSNINYFPVVDAVETSRRRVEEILENRFEFNKETYHLPTDFDWLKNPSDDIEWQILLHKFYYAPGLGEAFRETGDERFLQKWVELLRGWMAVTPPGFIASDVTGRRVPNWIFSHWFFVSPESQAKLEPAFYLDFLASLYRQTSYLCENLTPKRNHRTLELTAIFMTAMVFPEFRDADAWLDFSRRELHKNICEDLLPDGVQCELSTDYHHIVLRNYLRVRKLAHLNRVSMPSEMDERIRHGLDFALHCHKPDGRIPSLSDGDTGDFRELLAIGYELYGDETYRYVATGGEAGIPPNIRAKHFENSGYIVLRSGWGERKSFTDERYLMFDCGPLGEGNHGHIDFLSFEMAAFGRSLIVDPGRYTYHEDGDINWRARFRGTSYHNTVRVDGKNQVRYEFHPKKGKFWIVGEHPEVILARCINRVDYDLVQGSIRSAEYDAIHERAIFFVAPEYWIVSDFLSAETAHRYDLQFHLSETATCKTTIRETADSTVVESPNLLIAQPQQPDVSAHIGNGFVSPIYGVKHPAPVLRFSVNATNTAYHSVVLPFKSEKPQVSVVSLPVFCEDAGIESHRTVALEITITSQNSTVRDLFFLAADEQNRKYHFGNYIFRGSYLFMRQDNYGWIRQLHTSEAGKLRMATAAVHV